MRWTVAAAAGGMVPVTHLAYVLTPMPTLRGLGPSLLGEVAVGAVSGGVLGLTLALGLRARKWALATTVGAAFVAGLAMHLMSSEVVVQLLGVYGTGSTLPMSFFGSWGGMLAWQGWSVWASTSLAVALSTAGARRRVEALEPATRAIPTRPTFGRVARTGVGLALVVIAALVVVHRARARQLFRAASQGNIAKVERLLDTWVGPSSSGYAMRLTALHGACQGGHADVVELLLERGADPDVRTRPEGSTPLRDSLTTYGLGIMCFGLLLDHGANASIADSQGKTPLHHECSRGANPAHIQMLLDAGADPNARDDEGRTPLHEAAGFYPGHGAVVLIKAGADLLARDNQGQTPGDVAVPALREKFEARLEEQLRRGHPIR